MNTYEMLIELRALELFRAHYSCRPHITTRDYSMVSFYRQVAENEQRGIIPDLEATREAMGGSFN